MERMAFLATMITVCGLSVGCSAAPATEGSEVVGQAATQTSTAPASAPWLALGDSIAFGYDPNVTNPFVTTSYVGYPDAVASVTGTHDSNAGCPGETSASFLDTSKPDNGCQWWRAHFPLHVAYAGSQMAYAVSFLAANPSTKYITFNMGANDLFLLQNACAANPATELSCIEAGLPATLQAYGQNVATAFGRLKAAGFTGQLIAMTTYTTDYNNALDVQALSALNGVLAQVAGQFGATVADGYGFFQKAAVKLGGGDACKAGLLIKMADGTCNIHPNQAGRDVLAAAVLSVVKP